MNPNPPPTPEPIVSLPISTALLGLLLILASVALLVLWLARRKREPAPSLPGLDGVPWLAALVDGLPQAALVVDLNGQSIASNAIAIRTLSLDQQATDLPPPLSALVARVLHSGVAETTEIALPRAPNRRLWATVSPLARSGLPFGALVLVQDPTKESKSAESYRRLISALAHELRTPLTAILGHADILSSCQPGKDEDLWHRSRDFIASEAERLARLVEDLLRLSRLDLTPLQRRPVNLSAVAEEAISALFQAAEARGVQLSLQAPPNLPRVLGDRDRLQQVFVNLLDNAIKYSPAGGTAVVRLLPEEKGVRVEVQDDGVGIASEDLPHVFKPLYRGQDVGDKSGTGLGLTIVRAILEQHGTPIRVQSAPGQGTTFHFGLPYAQSDQTSPSSLW